MQVICEFSGNQISLKEVCAALRSKSGVLLYINETGGGGGRYCFVYKHFNDEKYGWLPVLYNGGMGSWNCWDSFDDMCGSLKEWAAAGKLFWFPSVGDAFKWICEDIKNREAA